MLKLLTSIGLTQAGLADLLGVSRRAVGEWEAAATIPNVQQHVFAPEREEEEIRALWKTAHQRVLLDEAWLSTFRAITAVVKTTFHNRSHDFAHGPILIELERRVLISFLPDREAATLKNWLGEVLPGLVFTSTEEAQQEKKEV